MQLRALVQDGTLWMSTGSQSVEMRPRRFTAGA
jgi:hypothetical protein